MYPFAQAASGVNGEIAGATSATVLPTIASYYARLKAAADNVGKVYIGFNSNVTKADGATDTTTGWPLAAGEDTGWLPIKNLNMLYLICDNAGDDLIYQVLRTE